jgi:short subunit fatty acids transporter
MTKLKKLFGQTEFQVLLFFIYLGMICLPYIVFQNPKQPVNMYAFDMFEYFFVVWGLTIVILALIARNIGDECKGTHTHGEDGN